jgi:malate permease and related proteins
LTYYFLSDNILKYILTKESLGTKSMSGINSQFILSMSIIALGYIVKRLNIITEKDGESLIKIIFTFTLPALIISTFSTIKVDYSLGIMAGISFVYGLLIVASVLFIYRNQPWQVRGTASLVIPGFNVGLFAFPIVEAVWGAKAIKYLAMFDIANAFILYILTYFFAAYFSGKGGAVDLKTLLGKLVKSVPLMCYVITLAVNLSGFHFPGFVLEFSNILSRANMALSMLVLGIFLSFSFEKSFIKRMAGMLAIRYAFGLMVGLILFFLLPFEPLFRYVLLIALILPAALSAIIYSVPFGYNPKYVGTFTNVNNIISFALMWIIFSLARV